MDKILRWVKEPGRRDDGSVGEATDCGVLGVSVGDPSFRDAVTNGLCSTVPDWDFEVGGWSRPRDSNPRFHKRKACIRPSRDPEILF